ncbi:MAG: glycosyltransferase [Pseudomonadota bacterium]
MKTAIATSDYFVPGETFVNRHIEHLFDGATCIVAGRFDGNDPIGRPLFERRRSLGLADTLRAPFALSMNALRHSTSRVPFGASKSALKTFLQDQKVELVLAEFGTQALAVAPLAREIGLPCVSYFRGTDASKALRRRQTVRAYRRMFPHLAGIVAVSQFLLDNLAAEGLEHPNAHVIPSGVNTDNFKPGEKERGLILALGRFIEKKAPLTTVRAFAEAAEGLPHARLEMIGDGPLMEPARSLARELGVGDRVRLPGRMPHDAVRDRLGKAEIFAQHSVTAEDGNTEGLPTAIQEALASGCVIVSTRHAGIPEAVEDGKTGHLVDEHDQHGFARQLRRLLDTKDLAQMANAARDVAVTRFDNRKLLTRLEAMLRKTVGA